MYTSEWRPLSRGYSSQQDVVRNLAEFPKLQYLAAYDISNRPGKLATTIHGPTTLPSSLVRIKRYVISTLLAIKDLADDAQQATQIPRIQFLSAEGTILSQYDSELHREAWMEILG